MDKVYSKLLGGLTHFCVTPYNRHVRGWSASINVTLLLLLSSSSSSPFIMDVSWDTQCHFFLSLSLSESLIFRFNSRRNLFGRIADSISSTVVSKVPNSLSLQFTSEATNSLSFREKNRAVSAAKMSSRKNELSIDSRCHIAAAPSFLQARGDTNTLLTRFIPFLVKLERWSKNGYLAELIERERERTRTRFIDEIPASAMCQAACTAG